MTEDRGRMTDDRRRHCARQARKDQGEKGKKLADRYFIAFLAFFALPEALC